MDTGQARLAWLFPLCKLWAAEWGLGRGTAQRSAGHTVGSAGGASLLGSGRVRSGTPVLRPPPILLVRRGWGTAPIGFCEHWPRLPACRIGACRVPGRESPEPGLQGPEGLSAPFSSALSPSESTDVVAVSPSRLWFCLVLFSALVAAFLLFQVVSSVCGVLFKLPPTPLTLTSGEALS